MKIDTELVYQLRTADFDCYYQLQPASVLDICQDVAGVNAIDVDAQGTFLRKNHAMWVLTRMKYIVDKIPRVHERVLVKTWTFEPTRLGFRREYLMRTLDKQTLVRATSTWILMSTIDRSFISVKDVWDKNYIFPTNEAITEKVRKVPNFDATGKPHLVVPGYSDIDVNGHVNNTYYANFALDALAPSKKVIISSFQIDYRHEVMRGQRLEVYAQHKDDLALVKGINTDGNIAFACRIEFAPDQDKRSNLRQDKT